MTEVPGPAAVPSCDEPSFTFWLGGNPHWYRARHRPMPGKYITTTWPKFCSVMETPWIATHSAAHTKEDGRPYPASACRLCKAQRGCLTPAVFRSSRRLKSDFLYATGWHLDTDWNADVDYLQRLLVGRCRCLVHSTFTSSAHQRRARIIGVFDAHADWPTAAAATRFIARVWLRAAFKSDVLRSAEAAGIAIDGDATIPAQQIVVDDRALRIGQLAYLPMIPVGGEANFRVARVEGPLLNAQACAAAQRDWEVSAAGTEAKEVGSTCSSIPDADDGMTDWRAPVPQESRRRYLTSALAAAAIKVRTAPKGTGHNTLRDEAQSLGRYPELSVDEILSALAPAYVARGGHSAEECRETVRSAVTWRRQTLRRKAW